MRHVGLELLRRGRARGEGVRRLRRSLIVAAVAAAAFIALAPGRATAQEVDAGPCERLAQYDIPQRLVEADIRAVLDGVLGAEIDPLAQPAIGELAYEIATTCDPTTYRMALGVAALRILSGKRSVDYYCEPMPPDCPPVLRARDVASGARVVVAESDLGVTASVLAAHR